MATVSCETIVPQRSEIAGGRRVYRSNHFVTVSNDTGADILYNVEAIMFDSLGHSVSSSALNVVASSDPEVSFGAYVVDLDANLFEGGVSVELTCETHVTGGLSASDRQTGPLVTD